MGRAFGRYELKAKVAQGGMAEVFVAVQRGVGGFEKLVAIKQLLPHLEDEPGFLDGFLDEARIAASLQHPNVCQIFELGREQGRHFIAMEYLSGQSLARVWKKGRRVSAPLPPQLAAWIVARAAEGLAHAHERIGPDGRALHIVHRDVSPENIVITYDGQVKVVDFGIAHAANRLSKTKTGLVKGKLSYMAPEQLQSQPVDARADVFALGVVLHEAIAGGALFTGASEDETVRSLLFGAVPSLSGLPGVPPALAEVVQRALSRDPAGRTQSARELARSLDAALAEVQPAPGAEPLAAHVQGLFAQERADELARLKAAVAPDIEDFLFGTPAKSSPAVAVPAADTRKYVPQKRGRAGLFALVTVPVLAIAAWGGATLLRAPPPPEPAPSPVQAAPPVQEAVAPPRVEEPKLQALPVVEPPARPRKDDKKRRAPRVEAEPRAAAVAAKGRLTLDTVPWTEVFLGERKVGVTPLIEVELPAGRQTLRLRNPEQKIDRAYAVDVQADQTVTVPRLRL